MVQRPLLIPLASLIAGLFAADLLGATPPAWALPALAVTSLAALFVNSSVPFLVSLSALTAVWGALSLAPFLAAGDGISGYAGGEPVVIEGVVDERPELFCNGGSRVPLQVERIYHDGVERSVSGRVLINVEVGRANLATGDRIIFTSKLRRPRNYGLPGETDSVRRLAYKRIFTTAFVKGGDDLVLLKEGEGWRHRVDLVAAALGDFITAHAPGVEGGVLKALLLGDKGDIPQDLQDAYARSGVSHILSISGFHVGIIFLAVFQLLFLVGRCFEYAALRLNLRKALLMAALPVVLFYLFLSGAAPATVRSVLMIAALVAALSLRREVDPVNSVLLAASLILFSAPQTVFDLSFQLSFIAIWGLVALAPHLGQPFQRAPGVLRWFLLLLAASAAAILATLVPVAYYFHRIPFIGLLANLVIVPLLGYGAVVGGFLSLPLSTLAPWPAAVLLQGAARLVQISDDFILYLARVPVLTGYAPTRGDVLIACLILCALTFPRRKQVRLAAASLLILLLAVRALPAAAGGDPLLHLYFLSVGQGDATLIHLPDGKWMLLDGGGRAGDLAGRVGERLLLPALHRLGVRRIDYLVLSHEHPDHLQGVLYLARSYDIGEFWESGIGSSSPEYRELKWVLSARGIPVRRVDASLAPFAAGGAVVEPLWPDPSTACASDDANDRSLVFRLRYGKSLVLFPGDVGAKAEEELVQRGAPLTSSLLKVPHHGSRHSSSDLLLAAARPKMAVISAGYANPFHLPAPSTVKSLEKRGIRVYRTDLDGTVEALCTDDGRINVSTPWGHFN